MSKDEVHSAQLRITADHPLAPHANRANTKAVATTDLIHGLSATHPNCAPATKQTHTMPPPRLSPALLRARPQARYQCLRRIAPLRYASTTPTQPHDVKPVVPWKTPTSVWSPENLIPPPKDGEILLERRPNRALPPYVQNISIPPALHRKPAVEVNNNN